MSHLLKARIAVFLYFTLAGAAVTIWAVHIPQVETRLDITHAQTGTVLLLLGAGALVSMQVMGHLIDRVGSRTSTVLGALFIGVALLFPGQADSLLTLAISIFFLGMGIGATDIAMNAHALEVEKAYGRPIFSAFHAMWSLGGLIGAAVGGFALSLGWAMPVTLSLWGGVTIVLALIFNSWLLPNAPSHASASQGASKSEGKAIRAQQNLANRKVVGLVIFLGLLSASAAIVEGVGIDWSALHQVRVLGTSESAGAWAVIVFAGTMGIVRLFVDRLVGRLGRLAIIRIGTFISIIGITIIVFSTTPWVSLPGWAIAGLGISAVVPQFFAFAGDIGEESHSGRNMAKVVGITYAGVLGGPALIGWLTNIMPLNIALGTGILLGLFTLVGSLFVPTEKKSFAKTI